MAPWKKIGVEAPWILHLKAKAEKPYRENPFLDFDHRISLVPLIKVYDLIVEMSMSILQQKAMAPGPSFSK